MIHSQGTKISSKMPLLEHHNAIGREMSNLCAVSWPTSLCLHHLYTHRSSTSGSLRVLSFKKKSVSAKQNHSIWGGRQSLPKPTDCNSFTCNIVYISLLIIYSSSFVPIPSLPFHALCQFSSSFSAFLFPCLVNRFLKLQKIKVHWKHVCVYVPLFNTFNVCLPIPLTSEFGF